MSERKDGGSAFPEIGSLYNADENLKNVFSDGGMSLRDWFAGQVITGMTGSPRQNAEYAYMVADALIEARDK